MITKSSKEIKRGGAMSINTQIFTSNIYYIILFLLWYSSSAITNNIGKQILTIYNYPITLTWIQFGFVTFFSILFTMTGIQISPGKKSRIRPVTLDILKTTSPLSLFQIASHIFSSISYTYLAISFAHTIKALAPLFTVLIYRMFYRVLYSNTIYFSLAPLTIGVMLVCSSKMSFHPIGVFCALMSTIIFATQNIFSKKLFEHARLVESQKLPPTHRQPLEKIKLDKLNLLFYSAFNAFILMSPIWLYTEGYSLFTDFSTLPTYHITFLFMLNGVSHFAQNMFAFTILSLVSPVTYSIASLVKRIFVISASIVWFGDPVSTIQGMGILLTFGGLYLYDQARHDVAKSEAMVLTANGPGLPVANSSPKFRSVSSKEMQQANGVPRSASFNNDVYFRGMGNYATNGPNYAINGMAQNGIQI